MRKIGDPSALKRHVFAILIIIACALILCLPCSIPLAAQNSSDIEVTASIGSEKIGLDDTLLYTITFKGINNPSEPDLSALSGFNIRQSSRSTEFRFINGVSSYYTNFIYYLAPEKVGTFTLPPVTYPYQGKEYKTQPFKVTVVQGSLAPHQQPQQRRMPSIFDQDDFFSSPSRQPRDREIDIRVVPVASKQKVYKGEQLVFKVLLFTRNQLRTVNMVSDKSLAGFWQEWFPETQSIEGETRVIEGKRTLVYQIRKAALFPTNIGRVAIPSLKFETALREDAFGIFSNPQPIYRSTAPLAIEVMDLPPGATGLPVGRFFLEVHPARNEVNVNDILTLKIKISGNGNVKTITPPDIPSNDDFRVYPAKLSRDVSFQDSGISGFVEAEVPIAFKKSGAITIPALQFKYFDPAQGTVVTQNSQPIPITVTGIKEKQDSAETVLRTEIIKTGEDIDFIQNGTIYNQDKNYYLSKYFTLLLLIPFILNLLYLFKIFVFDPFITNNVKLLGRKRLNRAVDALHHVRDAGEISAILENYLKEKTGVGLSALTNQGIDQLLAKYGVADGDVKTFIRLKSESESSRFAPGKLSASRGTAENQLKHDINTLIDILKRIDNRIK